MSTESYGWVHGENPRGGSPRNRKRRIAARGALARAVSRIEPLESRVLLTTVVSPVADTFIRSGAYANTNYGASPTLYVQNAGGNGGDSRVALVRFDLANVNTINTAVLRAEASLEYPESGAITMGLYPVSNNSWLEGTGTTNSFNGNGADNTQSEITWNNAPAGAANPAGKPIATANVSRYGYETYSWDVTQFLQQQKAAGNTQVTLAFQSTRQGPYWAKMLSRENSQSLSEGPELVVSDGGATVPAATISTSDVTDPSTGAIQVSVTYSSDQPIDPSTINPGNISVSGPAGALSVLDSSISQNSGSDSLTAIYDVGAPSGSWTASANGLYTVAVNDHQVRDVTGGIVQPAQGQFQVAVSDNTAPTATISAPALTSAGPTYQFTVNYADNVAVDPSFVDVENVQVLTPGNAALPVLNAAASPSAGGTQVVYTVGAPSGGWSAANNGTYGILLGNVPIRDTAGNPIASFPASSFQVNIAPSGQDTTPPTAAISAPTLTQAGSGGEQVTVVYSDDTAVKASTISAANLTITGPAGPLTVTAVSLTPGSDSGQITAAYTVAAPAGGWVAADDGIYSITLNAGQVTDTSGNAIGTTSGSFSVNIPAPDTTPPTAQISAANVNSAGGSSESISVTYTDNAAVDISTISGGNITVVGPQGSLNVTSVQLLAAANGTPITAVYTVVAPHGAWSAADVGTYTVTVVPWSVKDTSGNGVTTATGTFSVSANQPDTTPPSAQITAADLTNAGGSTQTITVVFTDDVAVNASSINGANLSVTGPGGALAITAASVSGGNGSPLLATYTVAAPHGAWSSADNGSYTIALKANQVDDTSGNFANGVSGSFTVNIPVNSGNGPDMSFNNGQSVGANFVAEAILSQSDGKVLAVGRVGDLNAGTSQGIIERLNADGSLDHSFGNHGMIASPAGVNEAWFAAGMQDSSHFIVAGTSGGDFVLARYDATGKLDPTFGTAGRTTVDFGTSSDTARGLAIAPGGMIVAGGDSGSNFAFARFDANGNLDTNFAQNGRQLFAVGTSGNNGMGAIAVQSDGKVLAVGAEGGSVVVARLTAAGEADGPFGNGGLVTVPGLVARTDLGTPDRSEGLTIQPDGGILVANRTSSGHFGVVRLNPTGTVDTTFGTNGLVTASFGGDDDADSVVLQPTGAIVLIGTSLQNGAPDTAVAAFTSAGNPLTGFANNGLLLLPNDIKPSTLAAAHGASAQLSPSSLHVGDIVIRAFGTVTSDGRVVVGTSNEAIAATTSSTLRRLIVPGAVVGTTPGSGTLLGSFGIVNGKHKRLTVTAPDGAKVTFALNGGSGNVYLNGSDFNVVIDDLGKGVVLTITARGRSRVSLGDVTVSGTLRAMNAHNSDISGTIHVTGAIGRLNVGNISGGVWSGAGIAKVNAGDLTGNLFATGALGRLRFRNVTNGTIASGSGAIAALTAASLDNARVLSGANLGDDGAVGGTGTNKDTYGAGAIGAIHVSGAITSSFVGAGVDPVDTTFGNSNDTVAGGTASRIKSLVARSADQASRFEAGAFGRVRLPKIINVPADSRFKVL